MPTNHMQVAERLFDAIVRGDVEALRDVYAPTAVIWHNTDGAAQTVDQNLRVLRWVVTHIDQLRYEDVCRQETPSGFVQQHVLRGTTRAGRQVEIPACIVATITDGRIVRLDEYLDSASVAPLLAE